MIDQLHSLDHSDDANIRSCQNALAEQQRSFPDNSTVRMADEGSRQFEWQACKTMAFNGSRGADTFQFRIDNTEHVFVVRIHDRVDFVCPFYPSPAVDQADVEVMEIHSVSKWAYDYCALSPESVVAGVCNNPFQRTYATVVFREYTPKPGGLEFKPGRSYYFISTSTGQSGGLQNKHGGLCSSKHMKVKFEIEAQDAQEMPTPKFGNSAAAGGSMVPTKSPGLSGDEEDAYDGQYQVVSPDGNASRNEDDSSIVPGSSRTHDNSRELKKQNVSIGIYGEATTPRLYEIHTRPQDEYVGIKRTGNRENYGKADGTNAQQRRNAGLVHKSCYQTLLSLLIAAMFIFHFMIL